MKDKIEFGLQEQYVDGRLCRQMFKAGLKDDMILLIDRLLRNKECELIFVKSFISNLIKTHKQISRLHHNPKIYDIEKQIDELIPNLKSIGYHKAGDLIKILISQKSKSADTPSKEEASK